MRASGGSVVRGIWSRVLVRDALFALIGAFVSVAMVSDMEFAPGVPGTATVAAIWSFLIWIPVAWRRKSPAPALFAVAAIAILHLVFGHPILLPADLAVLVVLYSVSAYGSKWAGWAGLALAIVGSFAMSLNLVHFGRGAIMAGTDIYDFLVISAPAVALSVAAWALGVTRRARRETVEALKSRADALEERAQQLEFERDQQRIIATQAERARIAREMHDIVAHSLSIMIVQADGGRYATMHDGAAAGQALTTISETGRSALKEMRRLLGVLRSDDDALSAMPLTPLSGTVQNVGQSPLPITDATLTAPEGGTPSNGFDGVGLFPSGLTELFDQSRSAGMQLKVITTGEPRALEPGAVLTLQRVCQEALTNVRKHGGPRAKTTVMLNWLPDAVELTVTNSGYPISGGVPIVGFPSGSGYGLIGLQERAALVGGHLTAGPKPESGWQTKFTMPTTTVG